MCENTEEQIREDLISRHERLLNELHEINRQLITLNTLMSAEYWRRQAKSTLDQMITEARHER